MDPGFWGRVLQVFEKYGRHEGTRTPDLTVSILPGFFFDNLQVRGDCLSTRKSYKTSLFVGWVVGWQFPCYHSDFRPHLRGLFV